MTHLRDNSDVRFYLVHCNSEDVSINSICLNVLEGIEQFYLLIWFKKTRLETPFKGNNVKALVKTSNFKNLVLYFSEKVQKIAAFAMLFWFNDVFLNVLCPQHIYFDLSKVKYVKTHKQR